jgi:hypothetical protein
LKISHAQERSDAAAEFQPDNAGGVRSSGGQLLAAFISIFARS